MAKKIDWLSKERPLIELHWPELKVQAEESWDDVGELWTVLRELTHRTTGGAVALRERVARRWVLLLVECLKEVGESFHWPSTEALPSAVPMSGDHFECKDGLLSFLGYHVGKTAGLSIEERRPLLDFVYLEVVPRVQSPEYMKEWGKPRKKRRLQKLANSLASFAVNKKRDERRDNSVAIAHWEADLEYLRRKYYVGHYDSKFQWPDTLVAD